MTRLIHFQIFNNADFDLNLDAIIRFVFIKQNHIETLAPALLDSMIYINANDKR